MCVTCGCGEDASTKLSLHDDGPRRSSEGAHVHTHAHAHEHEHDHEHEHAHTHEHDHEHGHEHDHEHGHEHDHTHEHVHPHAHDTELSVPGRDRKSIELEAKILGKNQLIAERNRGWLDGRGILALNLVSSPGAGKTTLLERTLADLLPSVPVSVIEGDQATSNDAERIRKTGVRAVQINTGTGCHLEADMVERALTLLRPQPDSLLFIENIGNLVCPALFDLGEDSKVVIFSVTEGEDKPLKYPHMFAAASIALLSKTDLLPHVRFDVRRAITNALTINPELLVLELSAQTGDGLERWYGWLKTRLAERTRVNA